MRVLLLRPEPQARTMAATLREAGIAADVLPMLAIVPVPDVAATIAAAGDAAVLVFTSTAGVEALAADPASARLVTLPAVAVGPATADAARRAGFSTVLTADGDGAAAARVAAGLPIPTGGTIIHVAAEDLAFDVAGRLVADGRSARMIVAYRAEAAAAIPGAVAADLAAGAYAGVVVASERTAATFGRCLEQAGIRNLPDAVLVAISAKAAAPLRPFFDRLVVADAANGESLTKAVVALGPKA